VASELVYVGDEGSEITELDCVPGGRRAIQFGAEYTF